MDVPTISDAIHLIYRGSQHIPSVTQEIGEGITMGGLTDLVVGTIVAAGQRQVNNVNGRPNPNFFSQVWYDMNHWYTVLPAVVVGGANLLPNIDCITSDESTLLSYIGATAVGAAFGAVSRGINRNAEPDLRERISTGAVRGMIGFDIGYTILDRILF